MIRKATSRYLHQATEAQFLFPALACIFLLSIWGLTLNLVRSERVSAELSAAASSHQLAETYESQVVRSLREIDQALKIVKYETDLWGLQSVLPNLQRRELLPPTLIFTISITDSSGNIVVSTDSSMLGSVADKDYFQNQVISDAFFIGLPQAGSEPESWQLHFSRRLLDSADGSFSGVVMVSVDAAFFVSSYNLSVMGEHGLLGLLGRDDVFRIRRTGETFSAGSMIDSTKLSMYSEDDLVSEMKPSIDVLDGVQRYLEVRELYEFPLLVFVGLSVDEQLVTTRANIRTYYIRASAASVLLILIIALLGYMRWQLVLNRRQFVKVQLAQSEQNEYLAYHDILTGLPNRSLFSQLLSQGIQQAHRNQLQLAVLFLDLDRFKHINDTLGHECGDQLLKEVSSRLKACLRDSDTVARLGGDEFVVLLPGLQDNKYVETVAKKILTAVARPYILEGQEYRVTASVGISFYPEDGLDEESLTKNADVAMYHAKEEGKNNYKFYSIKLNASSLERFTMEKGLREALKRNEFQLHYQAKRDTHSGLVTGMEALLRWHHPEQGVLSPVRFLSLAEETGLIMPIGKWVLKAACLQNMAWQEQGLPPMIMAINLTQRQFEDETLLPDLKRTLAETGMDPKLLELEISEMLLMRDIEKNLLVLKKLKEIGVRIAIDDFGVGYASLTTLKQFPLDTIKIDPSYMLNITSIAKDRAMTEAILAMGNALNLTVVAQGVETKAQADILREQASGEFQGYYLNKPMPADQIAELLLTHQSDKKNNVDGEN